MAIRLLFFLGPLFRLPQHMVYSVSSTRTQPRLGLLQLGSAAVLPNRCPRKFLDARRICITEIILQFHIVVIYYALTFVFCQTYAMCITYSAVHAEKPTSAVTKLPRVDRDGHINKVETRLKGEMSCVQSPFDKPLLQGENNRNYANNIN